MHGKTKGKDKNTHIFLQVVKLSLGWYVHTSFVPEELGPK